MVYRRLRDLREDHDWTQKQLAKMLNMSQTGYSKYETGENDIPTSILIKLSQLYQTSIDYLLDQTNEIKRYPEIEK
ncbi:MAG: helix-turn-helix transcriptional regulator [Clostridia bacterium]|nr:helix-turn-helix transcriptional regulator [Clostridia bacterium]